MAEFIGSRIALISKSEIRYVGTLREINSETATVSLEHVTCSGTEGRLGNPDQDIPASDQIYDGIVFRGSDVKDLRILAPPGENQPPQMPNDPAILGTSQVATAQPQPQLQQQQPPHPQQQQPPNQYRGGPPYQQQNHFGFQGPPPNQFHQQPRFQGPGGPHGFPGSPGAVPGYGMGYGGPPPPGYGMGMGYGPPPGQGFPQHPQGPFPPQQQQMPIGTPVAQLNQQRPPPQAPQHPPTGSKQGTPQPASGQAPQPPQSKPAETPAASAVSAATPSAPPPPLDSKPPTSAATAPSTATQPPPAVLATRAAQRASNRVAVPLPTPNADPNRNRVKPHVGQQIPLVTAAPQMQEPAGATDAATAAVAAAMAKLAVNNPAAPSGSDNLAQKVNQMRAHEAHQPRGRGRGRGGAPRGGGGRRESAHKTVEVPKEDFDFETSNAKFNKHELAKEAIATGSPMQDLAAAPNGGAADAAVPSINGHSLGSDASSAAAVVAATDDVVIPAKPSTTAERGYDKKSSFFDNISSDLRDRVEQKAAASAGAGGDHIDGRAMRREERSKNMETFGQGSVDGGGYRGRGRGRGRGFGRGGRGYFGRGRGRGGAEAAAT